MKRSAAVQKMVKHHQDFYYRYKKGLSILDYYSSVLRMLESEGLTPPIYHKETVSEKVHSNMGNIPVEIEFSTFYDWEPEDE